MLAALLLEPQLVIKNNAIQLDNRCVFFMASFYHTSKKPLKQEILIRISEMLIAHIANIQTKPNAEKFLSEILTESEKIMLAKRFAIVVMLSKKQSYATITKILKVTPQTIAKINKELDNREFDFIISQLKKTSKGAGGKSLFNFSIWLDVMLGMRLPPQGKGRWKFIDEIAEKQKRR